MSPGSMKNILTKITFLLFLSFMLFSSHPAGSSDEDYCTDSESWKEWDTLVEKYPDDEDIQTLHALRLGLCMKVQRGDITSLKATEIFEKARQITIEKKKSRITKK
jgi:hypothetical protein